MAIEIVFRLRGNGEDYLFWVSVHGAGGISFDPDSAIDRGDRGTDACATPER